MALLSLFLNICDSFLCALHRSLCGIATTQGPFPYKGPDAHNLPEAGTARIKFPIV